MNPCQKSFNHFIPREARGRHRFPNTHESPRRQNRTEGRLLALHPVGRVDAHGLFAVLTYALSITIQLRYRPDGIHTTGAKSEDGQKKTFELKSTGEERMLARARNTANAINAVEDMIPSD